MRERIQKPQKTDSGEVDQIRNSVPVFMYFDLTTEEHSLKDALTNLERGII